MTVNPLHAPYWDHDPDSPAAPAAPPPGASPRRPTRRTAPPSPAGRPRCEPVRPPQRAGGGHHAPLPVIPSRRPVARARWVDAADRLAVAFGLGLAAAVLAWLAVKGGAWLAALDLWAPAIAVRLLVALEAAFAIVAVALIVCVTQGWAVWP